MRAATKMLMISNARNERGGNRGGRSEMEMGGAEMRRGYEGGRPESRNGGYGENRGNYPREEYSRYEGREGRENYGRSEMEMRRGGRSEMRYEGGQNRIGYEGGGNARSEMDEMQSRRRYRRDGRGRFRSEMEDESETDMLYPMYPPPVYNEHTGMNQVGFSANDHSERNSLHMIRGGSSEKTGKLDPKTTEKWMRGLQNEDGTIGPHWTKEQTTQVMKQKNVECDPDDFYVAMNVMYSDYYTAAKKANANNVDFYVNMAKAFLDDKDAGVEDKLSAYYYNIVK